MIPAPFPEINAGWSLDVPRAWMERRAIPKGWSEEPCPVDGFRRFARRGTHYGYNGWAVVSWRPPT